MNGLATSLTVEPAVLHCTTVLYPALQLVTGLGGLTRSFSLLCVGRFVFGLGGESLNTALNTYTVAWFGDSKHLNTVSLGTNGRLERFPLTLDRSCEI